MTTIALQPDQAKPTTQLARRTTLPQTLLLCGVLSSLLYAAMNVYVPVQWAGYSVTAQTVSELSAIGAPTRFLWVALVSVYGALFTAFGFGVWTSAGSSRALRGVAGVTIAQGLMGFFWPPMHLRGAPFSTTDAMHIAFAAVTLLLMALSMGFGAAALGKRFRLYTIATVLVFVVFGTLTGMDSPHIAANEPTPWIGVWERINIAAFMSWVVVLAVALMRRREERPALPAK